uniref:sphingomyelin phosphodiesterase n=1 Tax=Rhipicephalus zambeziensis TaxID=60191 RepID=A0A224Z970_9ACAR
MKMEVEVRVLTLNCWGIVGISKHRVERMTAIANYLATTEYDFVFLQEVWSQEDFKRIRKKAKHNLPYGHYFFSGVLGSGVCLLSKSPIVDTGLLKYNLNGYAHKIFHGDWFGGKVVGLCKVRHRGLNVNLYVTHLHAEYNRNYDTYLSHRICQSFELSQYVKHTSATCDLAILAGDFNTEPLDPPYNIIIYNSDLVDAFVDQEKCNRESMCVGATCGHPDNKYTTSYEKSSCPTGKRIDYVMYKVGRGVTVTTKSCMTLKLKTPSGLPFSDHEPVEVVMRVNKSSEMAAAAASTTISSLVSPLLGIPNAGGAACAERSSLTSQATPGLLDALHRGQEQLQQSMDGLHLDRIFYIVAACFMACILAATVPLHLPQIYHWILVLSRTIAAMLLGFCLIMAFFWTAMEKSSLMEARKAMRLLWKAHTAEGNFTQSLTPVSRGSIPCEPLLELQGDQRV